MTFTIYAEDPTKNPDAQPVTTVTSASETKYTTKERLSVWQKYFINGEYLRSAEMAEEQNYNMIDGRINNLLPKKENPEVPKKRKSVLLRLYKHRCEVAKKQGKIGRAHV